MNYSYKPCICLEIRSGRSVLGSILACMPLTASTGKPVSLRRILSSHLSLHLSPRAVICSFQDMKSGLKAVSQNLSLQHSISSSQSFPHNQICHLGDSNIYVLLTIPHKRRVTSSSIFLLLYK